MIIDFHTHAFVDALAEQAIKKLSAVSGFHAYGNGTHAALSQHMEENGIDLAVVLNIAVKPHQAVRVNTAAMEQDGQITNNPAYRKFIQFGSLHPLTPNLEEEAKRIKAAGMKGVKIHPDYQGYYLNDPIWYPIFELCAALDLPVITHAGFDPIFPDVIHATPAHTGHVLKNFPHLTFIVAHMGGIGCFDETAETLGGRYENLYFDTAFIRGNASQDQLLNLIRRHGSDRIVFGSDYPWDGCGNEVKLIQALPLPEEEKEKILGGNAKRLLNL
ncbi:MAG TPA: hypothetical protein DER23_06785 [Clostridiales bacterium]|nr:hypothetical protein [Clostridiales bacterium]